MVTDPPPKKQASVPSDTEPPFVDLVWWQARNLLSPVIVLLVLLILVVLAILYYNPFQQVTSPDALSSLEDLRHPIFSLRTTPSGSPLYYIDVAPDQKTTDIFTLVVSGTQSVPLNLTSSPDYSELFPVPSPTDDRLAFFAVSKSGDHSLRVLTPNAGVVDVTYQGGNSRLGAKCQVDLSLPPAWGPDGSWIAFLARCSDGQTESVELFAARSDGSEVRALSHSGHRVTDVRWLDDHTLIYGERRGDGTGALYQVSVADPQAQPVLLTTVSIPD